MRARIALFLIAAPVAAGALAADAGFDRRRTVEGVRIERLGEGDGGTLVRMVRRGRGYRFEYHLEFWRGNGGVIAGASFRRGGCSSGDSDMLRSAEGALARDSLHGWLTDYLRECPLAPAGEAALRRALDAAWPTFSAWANEAWAAIEAENRAILDYGREP